MPTTTAATTRRTSCGRRGRSSVAGPWGKRKVGDDLWDCDLKRASVMTTSVLPPLPHFWPSSCQTQPTSGQRRLDSQPILCTPRSLHCGPSSRHYVCDRSSMRLERWRQVTTCFALPFERMRLRMQCSPSFTGRQDDTLPSLPRRTDVPRDTQRSKTSSRSPTEIRPGFSKRGAKSTELTRWPPLPLCGPNWARIQRPVVSRRPLVIEYCTMCCVPGIRGRLVPHSLQTSLACAENAMFGHPIRVTLSSGFGG